MARKEIIDEITMKRAITRITYEIIERNKELDKLVLIGIKTRGVYLAKRIQERLQQLEGLEIPFGELDTRPFRDDKQAQEDTTEIDIDITGKDVILVDDVLYTGRTIRAAMNALLDLGRPRMIQLAVLIDRGHRELPIRADYVGKNVPTASAEDVSVQLHDTDTEEKVVIRERV